MAEFLDPAIELDGVDRTDWAHSIELPLTRDRLEVTPFRSQFKRFLLGRRDATVTVGFYQEFETEGTEAVESLDQQLWDLYDSGDAVDLVVTPREDGDVVYTAHVVLPDYTPMSGAQGEAAEVSVEFVLAEGGITRAPAGTG
jgi:hypothetical protein